MAYDRALADRVRGVLAKVDGVSEKKMFGGLCFMIHGNMAVGLAKNDLMIRVGPGMYESMRSRPHARPMDFTGRPLTGFLFVDPDGTRSDTDLKRWIAKAVEFAKALPPKRKKSGKGTGAKKTGNVSGAGPG